MLSVVDMELSKLSMELLRVIWARLLWLELLPPGALTADGMDIILHGEHAGRLELPCSSRLSLASACYVFVSPDRHLMNLVKVKVLIRKPFDPAHISFAAQLASSVQ